MIRAQDDEGLSEVVGFVLLLGVLVLALSVYQLYAVPAAGRENEIAHMNQVKDQFTDYKIALDSLWVNDQTGVMLSTAFDLGSGGAATQGGWLPFLTPTGSAGDLSIREGDTLTIATGDHPEGWKIELGTLEYTSENRYWVDQTWTYQMGGVFLSQDDGTALRLAPPFALINQKAASVTITPVTIKGSGSVGGAGPVRVETRLQNMSVDKKPYGIHAPVEWVRISITSSDPGRALAWKRALEEAPAREKIPEDWYQVTQNGNIASITIYGPEHDEEHKDVNLTVHRADFYTSIHGAAARIE